MAARRSKVVYVPSSRPTAARHVMGAHTGRAVRVVAFEDPRDALRAVRAAASTDLDVSVWRGRSRYKVPKCSTGGHVWATSVEELAARIGPCHVDVCEFERPGTLAATASFDMTDAACSRDAVAHLLRSWRLP